MFDARVGRQLKRQIEEEAVFVGFAEGEIDFQPTYKYDTGSDMWDTRYFGLALLQMKSEGNLKSSSAHWRRTMRRSKAGAAADSPNKGMWGCGLSESKT